MKKPADHRKPLELRMGCEAARQIRQHAHSCSKTEVCGVLIGSESDRATVVEACIPGANAVQGGAHVTFTQETWEHIYKIKDRDFPDARIVGWYHSHPGFGVFLSDHDVFIHEHFFSSPKQVAWVYDPHSDEEGCFGWVDGTLARLEQIVLVDAKGGEAAGETGKPEPVMQAKKESREVPRESPAAGISKSWMEAASTVLTYVLVFCAGMVLSWYLFPHLVGIPVDPRTGEPLIDLRSEPASNADHGAVTAPAPDTPTSPKPAVPAPNDAKGKR